MKKRKLQFTLFSKILAITSAIPIAFGFYWYREIRDIFQINFLSDQASDIFFYSFYITLCFFMAAMMIASYILARSVTAPIEHLVDLTKEVSKGDLTIKAQDTIKGSDEITELAEYFDLMTEELKNKAYLKNILHKLHGQVLSDQFMEGALEQKSIEVKTAVLFLDIRDFTKMSENKPAHDVVEMLNNFFEQMVIIVKKHGGVIDKFMGDSFMAIWGIPTSNGDIDVKRSFDCAKELRLFSQNNQENFKIGIGIDYGSAILGCIGSREQLDYTVIGDVVNTASRIQKVSKNYSTEIMISCNVYKNLSLSQRDGLELEGDIQLSGKSSPLSLYSFRDEKDFQSQNIKAA